jgi:hypothetical protein
MGISERKKIFILVDETPNTLLAGLKKMKTLSPFGG